MNLVDPTRPLPGAEQQMDFLLALFRPLLTVDEARYLLADPSPQLVIRRLEDGTLRGVDISAAGRESGRRELRIYRYSVEYLFCPAMASARAAQGHRARAPRVAVDSIFPHSRDLFRRDEVARLLNCHPKHVGNLPLHGPRISTGASAASADRTPRVARHALIAFLNDREITD